MGGNASRGLRGSRRGSVNPGPAMSPRKGKKKNGETGAEEEEQNNLRSHRVNPLRSHTQRGGRGKNGPATTRPAMAYTAELVGLKTKKIEGQQGPNLPKTGLVWREVWSRTYRAQQERCAEDLAQVASESSGVILLMTQKDITA